MYDPTVFDNLKVAIENHVYDLDNIDRKIKILNRIDQMDFAVLSRKFAIQFALVLEPDVSAEVILEASLQELAGEILEEPDGNPGCIVTLRFKKYVDSLEIQCSEIESAIYAIWENEVQLEQTLSFPFRKNRSNYLNIIDVKFKEKINEDNMSEIEDFLDHVLVTLQVLIEI